MTQYSGLRGLSSVQVKSRQQEFGLNQVARKKSFTPVSILVSQLASPLIYILIFAGGITFYLGDFLDSGVIFFTVLINTSLGFFQEYKAQRDLEALSQILSSRTKVRRGDSIVEIDTIQLVPGDIVLLEEGDKIPADGLILDSNSLMISEAILTGESIPIEKKDLKWSLDTIADELKKKFLSVSQRGERGQESVYMGSHVVSGSGEMWVAFTGGKTEIGKIAQTLSVTKDEVTPLQQRLNKLSRQIAILVGVVSLIMIGIGFVLGKTFLEMFTLTVAVAVSAIPEGLAISLTAILAVGMRRILKKKALVRKLMAAEVLGSVSMICCDKTGTLTQGQMKVAQFKSTKIKSFLKAVCLCNSQKDPLHLALGAWADDMVGKQKRLKNIRSTAEILSTEIITGKIPFSSDHKFTAVATKARAYLLGAPEVILEASRLTQAERKDWLDYLNNRATMGYRIVAVALKETTKPLKINNVLGQLDFLGLIMLEDPVRKGVKQALIKARRAGIGLKVITGDHPETARAVLSQLGIEVGKEEILLGSDLTQISAFELQKRLGQTKLFARTSPEQKLKIVTALQNRGEVVAMTGDGVNDAPALKKADIGIVVSSASDVSKEAADMVLLDDNFATIISAVREGRGIFDNLKKVIVYLLADSLSAVFLVIGSLIAGLSLPLGATQILWINFVTDGMPNLALIADPHSKGLLSKKPYPRDFPLVDGETKVLIGVISGVTSMFCLAVFKIYLERFDLSYAQSMVFALLGLTTLVYVFSVRSIRHPLFKEGFLKNKLLLLAVALSGLIHLSALYLAPLKTLLRTTSINLGDWLIISAIVVIIISIIEAIKWIYVKKAL